MSPGLPPGQARTALLAALEAVGAWQAGYGEEDMPELDHAAQVALAGLASAALCRIDLLAGQGAAAEMQLELYRRAHGIPASSS
jgi:hypothetical protein